MNATPADLPSDSAHDVPPPLEGCLYCHTEGATALAEGRKFLGFGSGLPTITCRHCNSVALFQAGPESEPSAWRIRYRKVNRAPRYYYAMLYLGRGGWLDADDALRISRNAYVQRQRVMQANRGELGWLRPEPLDPPPPLMQPDENVYLTINPVTLQQGRRGEQSVLDSGCFYVTDRKIHLLGHRRDWSQKLGDIGMVEHDEHFWRVHIGTSEQGQHYQGANHPDQIDAQLFTAVLKALIGPRGEMDGQIGTDDTQRNRPGDQAVSAFEDGDLEPVD